MKARGRLPPQLPSVLDPSRPRPHVSLARCRRCAHVGCEPLGQTETVPLSPPGHGCPAGVPARGAGAIRQRSRGDGNVGGTHASLGGVRSGAQVVSSLASPAGAVGSPVGGGRSRRRLSHTWRRCRSQLGPGGPRGALQPAWMLPMARRSRAVSCPRVVAWDSDWQPRP